MTAFDYAVIAVVGASVLLGLWRGVVSEVLALVAWVAAFFAAREWGVDVGGLFARWLVEPALLAAAGFVAVFVAVLVVFALGRALASLLLKAVGLGVLDRVLGGVFGVARGALMVFGLVLLGGMTALPRETWWREAVLAPPLETAAIATKPWLPADLAKRIKYR